MTTHASISFLNFDGTYEHQQKLTTNLTHRWVDFSTLRGTSLYCSPNAFHAIRTKLAGIPVESLTYLGSGNYHYTALALMQAIRHPFTLILFDHHTDLNAGRIGSLLSCGSWVHHAIRHLPELRRVIMIGPDPCTALSVPADIRQQTVILPDRRLPSGKQLLSLIPTDSIHISIDKDVLSPDDVKTNWDQGNLSLTSLYRLIHLLLIHKKNDGMDVCGEWPIRPHEQLNPRISVLLRKNEAANRQIARLYLKYASDHPAKLSRRNAKKPLSRP